MKICHISLSDISGGASRAGYRLHKALLDSNKNSIMCVLHKQSRDETVVPLRPPVSFLEKNSFLIGSIKKKLAQYPYRKTKVFGYEPFTIDYTGYGDWFLRRIPPADIYNLHITQSMIDVRLFTRLINRPLVITLHDMSFFTGGCHYDNGCGKFKAGCGNCPQLGSDNSSDLSRKVVTRKKLALGQVAGNKVGYVAPSEWMYSEASKSTILGGFTGRVIRNSLDLDVFQPFEKSFSRRFLGIPLEKKIVLYVADDLSSGRKGGLKLAEAIKLVRNKDAYFVSVGSGVNILAGSQNQMALGKVNNDKLLALVYSAADVVVVPSIQDNLPNVVAEALCCGVPVAAFDVGGIRDMVDHSLTGYLATPYDVFDLAKCIENCFEIDFATDKCRNSAESLFSPELQAVHYSEFYDSLR